LHFVDNIVTGKAVRVGLMGPNARVEIVNKFVELLDKVLPLSKKN
jgi:hypothetical protein